jgi:hypothetical protein
MLSLKYAIELSRIFYPNLAMGPLLQSLEIELLVLTVLVMLEMEYHVKKMKLAVEITSIVLVLQIIGDILVSKATLFTEEVILLVLREVYQFRLFP